MNCFLSGWAVMPQNINCRIIDSNKLAAKYKTIKNIEQNFDKIFPPNIDTLGAWSLGAIIVLGVLPKIRAKKIVLCSPALKFAAKDQILQELNKLRRNIIENKETALNLFFRKCAIPKALRCVNNYTVEELSDGLNFLLDTEINSLEIHRSTEIIVVCGENDKIIPQESSLEVADKLRVKPILIPNGSHFDTFAYFENIKTIRDCEPKPLVCSKYICDS
jgi:esterase/lipase